MIITHCLPHATFRDLQLDLWICIVVHFVSNHFARSHIIKCVFLSSVVFVLDLNLSVCFLDFINIAFCRDGNTTLNLQSTNHLSANHC